MVQGFDSNGGAHFGELGEMDGSWECGMWSDVIRDGLGYQLPDPV